MWRLKVRSQDVTSRKFVSNATNKILATEVVVISSLKESLKR